MALPISRLVSVQVSLESLLAQAPTINSVLVLGSSSVIDVTERKRDYATLSEVASDFGATAPEYLAAQSWFSQSPQPQTFSIGRWAQTATAGQLVGGGVADANLLVTAWTPMTSGAFLAYVDGVPYEVTGVNLGTATNLNGVASTVQTALRTAGATGATVVWNAAYNRFIVSSGTTGTVSTVSFFLPPAAVGSFSFAGQPANNDTITVNGTVVTFVTGTPVGSQVKIGTSLTATLNSLLAFLNSSVDANISLMSYMLANSATPTVLYAVSKATGTTGNAYTLVKSSTNISVSGATLAGGVATINDLSSMLALTAASSGAYAADGLAAEAALTAVQIADSRFPGGWYGLFVCGASDADHQAIAAYVEGANPPHYYVVNTKESGSVSSVSTSDIAYILSQLKYNKTAIQYSSKSDYAVLSYLARILTTDWDGENTAITLMYKKEPGIVAEDLNTAQANALQNKNCNVFAGYRNATSFIQYGTSCSGQFTDTVIGADWLSGDIQTAIFNVLYGAPTKVPQTDVGQTMLINAAEDSCIQGVTNAYLGRDLVWNSPGFGTLAQGDTLSKGFYVYSAPISTQPQAVRQTRAAPLIQVAAKTAGAIHTADVMLYIQQ